MRRKRRAWWPEYGPKVRFLQEVQRVPVWLNPEALAWMRHWRPRPGESLGK
jgi:hypothetical protein